MHHHDTPKVMLAFELDVQHTTHKQYKSFMLPSISINNVLINIEHEHIQLNFYFYI